jgi:hypothetical protein
VFLRFVFVSHNNKQTIQNQNETKQTSTKRCPMMKTQRLLWCVVVLLAVLFVTVSAQGNSGNSSKKKEGDDCQCRYGTQEGFDGVQHYFESPSANGKCSDDGNLVCVTEDDDGTIGKDFNGKCKSSQCFHPTEDVEGKITICHRTCSENNPWVRITIDANGWTEGHSCGHTTDTCNGKDLSYWGEFQSDYILKVHGTRQDVADSLNGNVDDIDDYWKHWEPACPSVRNGKCCFVDATSQYGYSCCGRAKVDPPMPDDFDPITSMPGPTDPTDPAEAPIFAPFAAPIAAPVTAAPVTAAPVTAAPVTAAPVTSAPVTSAPVTSAPVTAAPVTDAPVSAPTTSAPVANPPSSDGEDPFFEPPQCFARRLQDQELDVQWGITVPQFRYQKSLSFHLDFEISDYITSETMISHTVMDRTCTNSYAGAGLLHTRGLRLPIANRRQKVGVALWIDPDRIAEDTDSIYTDEDDGVTSAASVDFCLRFGLFTPPSTPGGAQEVNYMEVIVKFDADLSDGFEIGTINLEPRDRCEKEAQEAYEVEGYFCEDGTEDTPILTRPVLNQGQFVKVCVRPVQRALDQGVRLRQIRDFTWTLQADTGTGIQQIAVQDASPSLDGLTELHCTSGYAVCHFETLLYASFFATNGVVTGRGVADMQFGGQESKSSVSPYFRRNRMLRDSNSNGDDGHGHGRLLQIEPSLGGSAEFAMEADTAQSDGVPGLFWDSSDAATTLSRVTTMPSFFFLTAHTLIGMFTTSIAVVVATSLL